MTDQLEHQTDALAALLVAGDYPAAEQTLDALREATWRHRAGEIRARRHGSPGTRGAARGGGVLRCKPRAHAAVIATRPPAGKGRT
jgi:hypothetical protein